MKILQVNKFYAPTIGGVETVVQDTAALLTQRGHRVDVLACVPRGKAWVGELNGIHIEKAASFGMFLSMPVSFSFFFRFCRLVTHYDLVVLHHPFPLGFLAYLLFGRRTPMVVWYHADIVRQRLAAFLLKPALRATLRLARAILVSSSTVTEHSSVLKGFEEKCVTIPNGVDTAWAEVTPAIAEVAAKIRGTDPRPLIFTLGRAVSYKGFDYLIDAMAGVDARLILAGDGPLLPELKARAERQGVADKIVFPGAPVDQRPYYAACDMFVLPSVTVAEAFGIVQVEAMAFGKPVVNTSLASTVPFVSLHGETGLTVPPRDVKALAAALQRLATDPVLRKQYGDAARARFEQEFTKKLFADRAEDVFKKSVA